VWSLAGGRATVPGEQSFWSCTGHGGGNAEAVHVEEGSVRIHSNSFYQTVAGLAGDSTGRPGIAVGLRLAKNAHALAANNVLVRHGIGVSATLASAVTLDYNDLWRNTTDYKEVTPGPHDLHVDPDCLDPAHGDFHLKPDSPLIDTGTNMGAPVADFDGEPRPIDGNNDGKAVADIGVDEYWMGLLGSTKTVNRAIAAPGDLLRYQLTLVNPSRLYDLRNVMVTDTVPSRTVYAEGSLRGSRGAYGYANGVITWTVTVSASRSVTLTFKATIDHGIAGPYAIVNRAVLGSVDI
jgi:uncharacterized repeat protein (TIGR01451 family)